jgi:hypothetical protein
MTSTNARQLIKGACSLFGGLAQGESPTSDEEQDAYRILNELIDQWATQPWTTYTITRSTFSLAASVTSTTIGVSGTINQPRPERIWQAAYINPNTSGTTTLETAIPVLLFEQYAAIPLKAMTSTLPTALYYNPTSPLGTINVWPILTQTVTMVIYTEAPLAQFTDLTTATIFPPGYQNALKYTLAVLLAPEWGMTLPDGIEKRANLYLNDLKRANLRISTMPNAWGQIFNRGVYDIFSDTVR